VRLNNNYGSLHHKFVVVDGTTVETGSFNFTKGAAERNAENVIVLRDAPDIAGQYAREWQKLWNEGQDLKKGY
jgi:phosphatidylserine/phosphatidylglycerophosphate/cardiolipin synthase-like enzyme